MVLAQFVLSPSFGDQNKAWDWGEAASEWAFLEMLGISEPWLAAAKGKGGMRLPRSQLWTWRAHEGSLPLMAWESLWAFLSKDI